MGCVDVGEREEGRDGVLRVMDRWRVVFVRFRFIPCAKRNVFVYVNFARLGVTVLRCGKA